LVSSADLPSQAQLEAARDAGATHGDLLNDGTLPETEWMGNIKLAIDNVEGEWTLYGAAVTGATTNPVLGTSGQILYGVYRRMHGTVDFYINAKVGSAGFSAGSGIWSFSLPTSGPSTAIEGNGAGTYVIGTATVTDASDSFGGGQNANRMGVVIKNASANTCTVMFDAVPLYRSGTVTVASGAQSNTVTHNLGFTPTRCYVTPTSDWASSGMTRFWVSTKGSTTFTVNANAGGANLSGNQTFDWRAEYDNGISFISNTYPIPWASGDVIRISGRYDTGI
jgi:hypothetical protein